MRPAGNYGIQRVREGLLVTLIPPRGQSSALARIYKRRSDTFRTHLVYFESVIYTYSQKSLWYFHGIFQLFCTIVFFSISMFFNLTPEEEILKNRI